jgi:hypothetical protein
LEAKAASLRHVRPQTSQSTIGPVDQILSFNWRPNVLPGLHGSETIFKSTKLLVFNWEPHVSSKTWET